MIPFALGPCCSIGRKSKSCPGKVQQAGLTLIPLRMYFNAKGIAKIELGLAKGKKHYDRRETVKKREANREIERAMKGAESGSEPEKRMVHVFDFK